MTKVLLIVVLGGFLLIFAASRLRRTALHAGVRQDEFPTGLHRELWRQGWTPRYGSAFHGSGLIPILAYEMYPLERRRLYDWSRTLDTELLEVLQQHPEDVAVLQRVVSLQSMTRRVRRQLVIMAQSAEAGWEAGEESGVQKLSSELDVVEAAVERLSGQVTT